MRRLWTVTLLFFVAVPALTGENGLRVRLTLESSRALIGIPVGSELILENRTKATMRLPRRAYYRVHYLPTDEWTIARSLSGPYAIDLHESTADVVAPGQTVKVADLPSPNLFSTIVGGAAFLRPGTYLIDVLLAEPGFELSSASDPEHGAQVAALSSGLVTPAVAFTVEEPRAEDALVWARIAAATQNRATLLGGVQRPGEWIRPLVTEYPDSAYVPYLSDYYGLDDRASAAFAAKWLARDLPPSVKEWLHLRRARALFEVANMSRTDPSSRVSEKEALSIVRKLAKQATVPGMKEEAQRIADDIIWRRNPSKDTDID